MAVGDYAQGAASVGAVERGLHGSPLGENTRAMAVVRYSFVMPENRGLDERRLTAALLLGASIGAEHKHPDQWHHAQAPR